MRFELVSVTREEEKNLYTHKASHSISNGSFVLLHSSISHGMLFSSSFSNSELRRVRAREKACVYERQRKMTYVCVDTSARRLAIRHPMTHMYQTSKHATEPEPMTSLGLSLTLFLPLSLRADLLFLVSNTCSYSKTLSLCEHVTQLSVNIYEKVCMCV